jgi:hypothetical protein
MLIYFSRIFRLLFITYRFTYFFEFFATEPVFLTSISDRFQQLSFLWDMVTGVIIYECESALIEICNLKRLIDFVTTK